MVTLKLKKNVSCLFFFLLGCCLIISAENMVGIVNDMPVYPDAKVIIDGLDKETGDRQVVYTTYTLPVWVADFYRRTMISSGWQVVIQQPKKPTFLDNTFLFVFQKGKATFTVVVSRLEGEQTIVTTLCKKNS